MKKCVYPGSFDPISNGHLDIIKRAAKLFDEVHVVVSYNMFKKSAFSKDERIELIKLSTANLSNVIVTSYDGLVVNYCKENNINVIIRGMRNYSDYENEFQLFQYNKDINPTVETVILLPSSKNQFISSSAIKELVSYGLDISKYVPKPIVDKVIDRLK
ncbi:MAG: pantetheine-phosphate adenylyltransferase [Acholeplasmatales bacterium]|nr:pantetheine-phosphate adenylyltransferase [Acholeplasmatales bacterium]